MFFRIFIFFSYGNFLAITTYKMPTAPCLNGLSGRILPLTNIPISLTSTERTNQNPWLRAKFLGNQRTIQAYLGNLIFVGLAYLQRSIWPITKSKLKPNQSNYLLIWNTIPNRSRTKHSKASGKNLYQLHISWKECIICLLHHCRWGRKFLSVDATTILSFSNCLSISHHSGVFWKCAEQNKTWTVS